MTHKHLILLMAVSLSFAISSCQKEDFNKEREEAIEVYTSLADLQDPEKEPATDVGVDVRGGITELYIKSNIEFNASWQDALTSPWASVVSCEPAVDNNEVYLLKLKASRISSTSCYYTRRSGTLTLSNKTLNYGTYIKVHQGFTARLSCNFDNLRYGLADPRSEDGEKLISDWSATLRSSYKFTSSAFGNGTVAYCYGRNGYVKLGDGNGHGADLGSWYVEDIRKDSLLMVSFRAVSHVAIDGTKDANKFTVEVTGGGVIRDLIATGGTKMEFQAPWYDLSDETFPANMWKGGDFLVFIEGTETNPLTSDTVVTITAGNTQTLCPNNRLYVDNFYIRTINPLLGEDLFEQNGGSGYDNILGATEL